MSAIDKNHSGAASGINNAVSRVAGVLAIAVLGIVLVKNFATHLERSLPTLPVSSEAVQEIRAKEIELAGMELPKNLDPNATTLVRQAISESFLSGFRLVLSCCAVLAVASAAIAWRFVPQK
jgi:hypothetical protein